MNYRERSRERSLPRYHSTNGYNYDPSQPVYMMPVQMNGHGEMILLSPVGSEQVNEQQHKKENLGSFREPRSVMEVMTDLEDIKVELKDTWLNGPHLLTF